MCLFSSCAHRNKKKYLCETANFRNESESRTTCFKLRIGMKPRHTQPGWNKSGGRGQNAREQNPTHSRRGKRRWRKKRDVRPSSGESSGSGVHLAEGTSSSSTRTEHDILQKVTDLTIHVAYMAYLHQCMSTCILGKQQVQYNHYIALYLPT